MDNIQPGQTLGPYRIIGQIGQGGMATVYKAYHAAMDRYVAVKILPRQLAESPEFLGRFQMEARTIARLEHARILPVYDYGESAGIMYLVMRYLEAGTLKDRMKAGLLPLGDVDRLFTQLAEALDYAHRQGVVHRDLKPSNVMIDAQGDLFLTDFGIAKLLEGGSQFTSTGAMVGTPAYMSPEQAQGEKVDARTDIYSLGIILYEMVTGHVPFEAETPLAVVLKQISAPLPLPSTVKPDLAPAIERVLLKALAKNPGDRYETVADFLSAWKQAFSEASTLRAAAPTTQEIKAATPAEVTQVTPAPAPATLLHAAPPAPTPAAPARAGLPLGVLVGGGAAVVVLGLILAFLVLPRLAPPAAQATATTAATQAPQPTAAVAATEAPSVTSAPEATQPPTAEPAALTWRSWTASNRIRSLRIAGDELYAAGPGGVTVWSLSSGSVQRHYTTADGLPSSNVFSTWVDDDGTLWVATEGGLARLNPGESQFITYNAADGLDSNLVTALVRVGDTLVVGTQYSDRDGGGLILFDGRSWNAAPDFPSVAPDRALKEGKLANFVNVLLPAEGLLWVGTEVGLGRYERDSQTWTRFTTADGLPDDRILALYVDHTGALLVGTPRGAARFDGGKFTPADQGPSDGVWGIVEDDKGRYYFSGGGGIWRYDPANANWDQFTNQNGAVPVYWISSALAASDGSLFFATDGVGPLRYDGKDFTPWYVEDSTVVAWHGAILPVPDNAPDAGQLWFIEAYGSYADRYNLEAGAWEPYRAVACECVPLAFDEEGNVWGGRWQQGFVIMSPEGKLTQVSVDQGLPADVNVHAIVPLADGSAWIGTDQGLAHYEAGVLTERLQAADAGFASDFVRAVFVAADGTLWVSTDGSVSRRPPDGDWEHFTRGNPFDDNSSYATDFAEDADGGIWVATNGSGLYRYLDGAWTQYRDGQNGVKLPSPYVNAIARAPDDTLWFATSGGAAHFDGETWTSYTRDDGLINDQVNDVYVEPSGVVWFATAGGVSRFGP